MNPVIETITHNNLIIEICQDYDPENPREWENLGTMICWHKRYNLGDSNTDYSLDDYDSAEELFNAIKKDSLVVLPLYLYDHSGISMSTTTYVGRAQHASWDSGLVGYIYTTKEQVERAGVTEESDLESILVNEVEMYNHYLTGDVYGYRVYDTHQCDSCKHTEKKLIDSCWGYYSQEEALKTATELIEYNNTIKEQQNA